MKNGNPIILEPAKLGRLCDYLEKFFEYTSQTRLILLT